MHRLQTAELYHDKEQEETDGEGGVQEVLPVVQQAHDAQRDEVTAAYVSSSIG